MVDRFVFPVEQEPFPAELEAFVQRASVEKIPLVYIGLGSMLAVVFDDSQALQALASVAEAVRLVQVRPGTQNVLRLSTGWHCDFVKALHVVKGRV